MKNKNAAALVEALQIFDKYLTEDQFFTHCEHDELLVVVEESTVSLEDALRLNELGFHANSDGIFRSFRHGSC